MKILMSFLLLLAMLAMAAAGGHFYLQLRSRGVASDAPAPTSALQSGPVDPSRLFERIPPLAVGSPPPPAPLPNARGGALVLDAPSLPPPLSVSPTALADDPHLTVEPRLIDAADLEAPVEVLERRIAIRAKEILDKVPVLPVPLTDVRTSEQPEAPGR